MVHKSLIALAAAAVLVTAFAAPSAEAATKKERRYVASPTSYDGRVTGRPRTCGYDLFQVDNRGIPVGPYCH
jgi:hypothetical protein